MVSPVLILTTIVMTPLVFIAAVYFLVYFQAEEDKNMAWLPKVVVVFGFALSCLSVLLLPFDVANRDGGGFDMEVLWQLTLMVEAVLIVVVIPFCILYYESEEVDHEPGKAPSQLWSAIKWEMVFLLVTGLVLGLMYGLIGFVELPVKSQTPERFHGAPSTGLVAYDGPVGSGFDACVDGGGCLESDFDLRFRTTFPVYVMALLSFVGWFLLVLFGGAGLVALPMDLVNAWRKRPTPIDVDVYARRKTMINDRVKRLLDIADKMREEGFDHRKRRNKKKYNKFKASVYFVERDWERLKTSYKERGGNPFVPWFKLLAGVGGAFISIMWLLHIIVYFLADADPFLNTFFVDVDAGFGFAGTLFFGLFAFWLLWAVVKGTAKVGLRFFWLPIHPMRIGDTMMNSLLFNVSLILLSSMSVIQFSTRAFKLYARLTSVDLLFGVQVQYLVFFKQFWTNNVFLIMMLIVSGLTVLYLVLFPKDRKSEEQVDEEERKARKKALKF